MCKANKRENNFATSEWICPPRCLYNALLGVIFGLILAVVCLHITTNMLTFRQMHVWHNLSFPFRIIPPTFASKIMIVYDKKSKAYLKCRVPLQRHSSLPLTFKNKISIMCKSL